MKLKDKIMLYMNGRGWTPSWQMEDKAREWYTTGSTISRRCRELVNEDKLARRKISKTVEYVLSPKRTLTKDEANNFLASIDTRTPEFKQIKII